MFGKFFKAKGKLRLCTIFALCAVLLGCAIFAFAEMFGGGKNLGDNNSQSEITANAEDSVIPIDWTPTARASTTVSGGKITISGTCADMAAGWKAAIDASTSASTKITVILGNDWVAADEIDASNGTVVNTSFGEGDGYFSSKMLYVPEGKNIKIDLNGHSINRNLKTVAAYRVPAAVADGGCIKVVGGTLEIDDSTGTDNGLITGGYTTAQGAIYVQHGSYSSGTLIFRHGNITENESAGGLAGTGIRANGYGPGLEANVYMYGGKITNNKLSVWYGGGVFCRQFATFEMSGGEISGNIATMGGGAVGVNRGTFKMSGTAKLINNETPGCGGAVYIYSEKADYSEGSFQMSGGEISGNKAGTHGGGVAILANVKEYSITGGTIKNNTAAGAGQDISFTGTQLAWERAIATSKGGKVTAPVGVVLNANWVAQDILEDGVLVNTSFNGEFDGAEEGANLTTTPFYYGALCVPDSAKIVLDLYGYKLNRNIKVSSTAGDVRVKNPNADCKTNGRVILVYNNAELEITDSRGGGEVRGGYLMQTQANGAGIFVTSAKLTLSGGNITCNEAAAGCNAGAGVRLVNSSTFLMTGGEISYNISVDNHAGALFLRDNCTAIMSGGKIHHNTAKDGGGVSVWLGHFQMSGGTISDNTATEYGGGVYIYSGVSKFTMTGGTITNNEAVSSGGGVIDYGTVSLSGNVQIIGNKETSGTRSNVQLAPNVKITIAGLLTGSVGISGTKAVNATYPYTFTTGFGSSHTSHQAANYEKAHFFSDRTDASGKYYAITSTGTGTSKEAVIGTGTATTIPVPKPVGRTIVYDGTEQMIILGYDSAGMTPSNVTAGMTLSNSTYSVTNVGVGTYKVTFTLKSGYIWADNTTAAITVTGYITKAVISTAWKTVTLTKAFTGGEQQPELQSTSCNVKGTDTSWFIVDKYTDSGNYTAKATLKNGSGGDNGTTNYQANYCTSMSGSGASVTYSYVATTPFKINGAEITVGWTNTTLTYNGVAQRPTLKVIYPSSVTINMPTETNGFTYTNVGTNAGDHTVTCTLKTEFQKNFQLVITSDDSMKPTSASGYTTTMKYKINPLDISDASVTYTFAEQTYTGSALKPAPTVKFKTSAMTSQTTLAKDTAYTYADSNYSDNTNAGTAKLKITGKGNFTGTRDLEFTIKNATITGLPSNLSKEYNGTNYQVMNNSGTVTTGNTKVGISATVKGSQTQTWKFSKTSVSNWSTVTANNSVTVKNVADTTGNTNGQIIYYQVTAPNHDAKTGSFYIKVTQKAITAITGITVDNKEYNGNTTATLVKKSTTDNVVFTGMITGDELTISSATTLSFANKNVGTNKEVTVSGITLGGSSAGNYSIANTINAYASGTTKAKANITAKPITAITLAQADVVNNKEYDGGKVGTLKNAAATGTTFTSAQLITGDAVNIASATSIEFSDKNVATGKTVTVKGITLGGTDAGNYSIAATVGNTTKANITAKPITAITLAQADVVNNKEYDGGKVGTLKNAAATGTTFTSAQLITGDAVNIASATSIEFSDKNVATGKTVTVKGITLGGTDAGNYSIAATVGNTTKADITTKAITAITGITVGNKEYDGNTDAELVKKSTTDNVVFTGMITGDELSISSATTLSFANKNVGTGKAVTVSGITLGGADAGNYSIANTINAYASGTTKATANITKKAITGITNASFDNKIYDGVTGATLKGTNASATYAGMVSGDDLEIASATSINFASVGVGTGKTVTATGITLGGTDAGNYSIANTVSATGTADITVRSLTSDTTISVTGTYTYTGSALTPAYTVSNSELKSASTTLAVNTDYEVAYSNATNGGSTVDGDLTNAGTVTITITGKGNFDGSTTQTFVINKAEITVVTWDTPSAGYTYDGTAKSPKISAVTTAATAGLPANHADLFNYSYDEQVLQGTHTATAVLKDEYAANYEISGASDKKTVTATFVITLATINLIAAAAYVKAYDGQKHPVLTSMNAETVGDADNHMKWWVSTTDIGADESGWVEFTSLTDTNLPQIIDVKDSATYYFKITADNHAARLFNREAKVTAKSLGTGTTLPAGSKISHDEIPQYTYDGTAHEPTPTVYDDDTNRITTADYKYSYNNNIAAGTKTAVLTVTGQGNYTGSFQILYTIDAKAINDATIDVTGIADTVYNHGEQKESPTLNDTSLTASLLAEGTDYTVSYQTSDGAEATDFTNVGVIKVVIAGKGNYSGTRTETYEITPYDLSADYSTGSLATVANQTYTGSEITPTPALTVTFTGAVTLGSGDFDYSYTDNKLVGTNATVTVTGKGNYTGSIDGTFEIEPKLITEITGITADGKVYDGTTTYEDALKDNGSEDAAGIHYDSASITGNADGSELEVSVATGVFDSADAGTRTVTVTVTALTGSAAGNYKLPDGGITITIENVEIIQREIVITWGELEHVYDGANYCPTASADNVVEGDTVTLKTQLKGEETAIGIGLHKAEISVVNSTIPGNYKLPAVTETEFHIVTAGIMIRVNTDSLMQAYDGEEKLPKVEQYNVSGMTWSALSETNALENKNYEYTFSVVTGGPLVDGKPVNAGEYKVTVKASANFSWEDAKTGDTREFTLKITKAKVAGAVLTGVTEAYTGTKYELEVDWSAATLNGEEFGEQPDGVTVTYLYDGSASGGVANAGEHTVVAKFTVNGNYESIADLTAKITITKAVYELDKAPYGIELTDASANYDGAKHTLTLTGTLPTGVKVTYAYSKDSVSYGALGVTDVGEYLVRATFSFENAADGDNYELKYDGAAVSYLEATLTIDKQLAEVEDVNFGDATVVYDGNIHRIQVSGAAVGVTGVTYEYRKGGVVVSTDGVRDYGEYVVVAHFTVDSNYAAVADKEATLVIEKAQLTVTADAYTLTYGDDPTKGTYTASYSGLVSGDSASDLGTPVIRVNSGKYSIYGDVGTYAGAIEVSGLTATNYTVTYVAGTLTVKPRTVTVTWYNDSSRTAQDLTYTFEEDTVYTPYADVTNAVHGDVLIIKVKGGASNAGMNYLAEAEEIYLLGETTPAKNYTLPVNGLTAEFDILPKPPKNGTIIWDNTPLYYNGTEQVPKAYYYEDENDNTPQELPVTSNKRAVEVGDSYVAKITLSSNYTLTGQLEMPYSILAREVYIEIGDMSASVGAADVSGAEWDYVAGSLEFVSGESCTVSFTTGTITGAGKYPIIGHFTSTNASSYNVHFVGSFVSENEDYDGRCGTLTVTEGVYDMSKVSYTGTEVTYDGAEHAIAAAGLPVGITAKYEYILNGWSLGVLGEYGFNGVTDAGEYDIVIKFSGEADGYAKIPDASAKLKIKKASLTVKVKDKTIIYGEVPSDNGVICVINGAEYTLDSLTGAVGGALTLTTDYKQYDPVDKYRIVAAGLTAANYEITYVPGTLTVNPREVTVTWYTDSSASVLLGTDYKYDYDGSVHTPHAVASGMVHGDLLTLTVTVDGGFRSEAGLNYTARITGLSSDNYTVKTDDASVKFSIIEKNVVVWDNSEITYDGTAQYPKAYYYDEAGDRHELTDIEITQVIDGVSTVITDAINAGNYTVTLKSVPDGVDGVMSKAFRILPKAVSITIGNEAQLTYGEAEDNLATVLGSVTVTGTDGFVAADGITVKLGATVTDTSAVGKYAVTGEILGAGADNYAVTFVNGSLEIVKAKITASIAFNDASVDYDGKAHGLEITGELPDGVTKVTYKYNDGTKDVAASDVIAAGVYTVTATLTVDGNHYMDAYTLTAELTIISKSLTANVTFEGTGSKPITYDGKQHSLYVSGDMTGITKVTYTYDGASVAGVTDAGVYTVVAHFEVAANYEPIADMTATLEIVAATLTVTADNGAVEYGKAIDAAGYGYTVTGLALGDSAETVLGEVHYTYSYTAGTTAVGEYANAIAITSDAGASCGNYDIVYKAGKLTVTPYTLTADDIEWLKEESGEALGASGKFEYEYAAGALRQPYAATGLTGITLEVSGGAINAGYGYEAEVTGISGTNAGNYKLPAAGLKVTFDILPKPLSGNIVWDDTPLYYTGEALKPKAYYYDADGNEHELEVTVEGDGINVDEYLATVDVSGINYTLNGATEYRFKVLAREVYIEIEDMEAEYGTTPNLGAVGYGFINGSSFIKGEKYEISFTVGTIDGVGEYPIIGSFVSDNASNYKVIFSGSYASADAHTGEYGTLKVVKGVYDMSKVSFAGTEVTYDGTAHKLTVNGLPEGVTAACSYVKDGFGYADGALAAGKYTVTISFTGDANHEPVADKTATLTVKKASLTIKANDSTIIYGDAASDNGVSYTGFAGTDTAEKAGVLTGGLKYNYSYTLGNGVGEYVITPYGYSAANYEITYKTGTLTVAPRTITVTWYDDETQSGQSFEYVNDEKDHVPYPVAGGLVNGDKVELTVTEDSVKSAQGLNYTAEAVLTNGNYKLPTDGSARQTFSILPVAGSIVWDDTQLYYTGSAQYPKAYDYDASGNLNEIGSVVILDEKNNVIPAAINAGNYIARVSYKGKFEYWPFEILPLEVTVVIGSPATAIPYGSAVELDQSLWSYASGSAQFIGASPVELKTGASSASPAGTYAITGVCNDTNYKVTFIDGTLTISKATIDISGISYGTLTVNYDGGEHGLNITNLPAGVDYVICTYEKGGVSYGTNGVRDAGEYTVTIRFVLTDSANYNAVGDIEKQFTISKVAADLTGIVFDGETYTATYDGTAQSVQATGSAAGITGVTYTYYAADGVTPVSGNAAIAAGTYKVKAEFAFGGNYDVSGVTAQWATLEINKASLTVTANDYAVEYGATPAASGYGYTVSGLAATDNADSVLGTLTYGYSYTANAAGYADAGEYDITVSGVSATANYLVTYEAGKLTVTPREIGVTGWQLSKDDADTDLTYEYDGAEHIPYAVISNAAAGDDITLKVVVEKISAGANYLATVTAVLNADGTVNNNYKLPAKAITTQFTIEFTDPENHEFVIVWTYTEQYYDGTPKTAPTAEYNDGVNAGYIGVNAANITVYDADGNAVTQIIHAGKYTAVVTISDGNTYENTTTEFEVLARKVYIEVGNGVSKYGAAHDLSAVGYKFVNGSSFISGDSYTITLSTPATSASDVGKYPIIAAYTCSNDYEVRFVNGSFVSYDHSGEYGTLTIEKAVYDMSGVTLTGLNAGYDGTAHAAEAKNLPAGVTASYAYIRNGISYAGGGIDAGEYAVTVTFTGSANYEPIAAMTGVQKIAKAKLVVTANDKTIVYGDEPGSAGVSYAGFKGTDTATAAGVLGGSVSYEYGYVKGGNAGTYTITPKGLTAANYEITYKTGTLTVEKRVITVNWYTDDRMNTPITDAGSYKYDGKQHLPHAEAGNILAGDSVTLTVTGAQTEAGIGYKAIVTAISNNNYTLPADGAIMAFDIIPGAYIIVWESAPIVFDNQPHTPKAYYYTANGEQVEMNVSIKPNWGAADGSGVAVYAGRYTAVATVKSGNVDIKGGEWEHEFTIEQRRVTVVINDAGTAYGEEIKYNGWTYADGSDEFIGGGSVYLTGSVSKVSKVGTYEITGVYVGSDSYDVTFVPGTYTVSKAAVKAPVINGKVYTGATLKADIEANSIYSVYQNNGGKDAGEYPVILELLDYENYKWQSEDGMDIRSANYTVKFNILKAENAFITEFAVREIKAGQTIDTVNPVAKFGTAVVEFYKDAACEGEAINTAGNKWNEVEGTYYAKVTVEGTDNYDGLEVIYTFTVTGKLELDLYWGELTHEYDGTTWAPQAFVMLDGREIELVVTGAQTNADTYNASVTLTAKDGTDLSKYTFAHGAGAASTTVQYTITQKEITVYIKDMQSGYGEETIDVNLWNFSHCVIDGEVIGANSDDLAKILLNLSFSCDFGSGTYANAGTYKIIGNSGNGNYKVNFVGEDGKDYGIYTVTEAEIGVLKNGTTWFDEQGVIGDHQNDFIIIGETDSVTGEYKYLNIKGGQTARIYYSTVVAEYDSDRHDNMTDAMIRMMFAFGEQQTKPQIIRGGSWVVYYRIEADNHTTRYGIWKVLIDDPENFVIITFVKPYKVSYGDVISGKNILPELVEQGCIKLSGKVVPDTATLLRVAEAYAFEDVQNEVNGGTGVDKYAIRLNFNSTGMQLYGKYSFKYSASNDTPDTNLDKFEVTKRNITVNWENTTLTANGSMQLPAITISGFVGGQTVSLNNFTVGEPMLVELDNGDIITVTVLHTDGDSTMTNGSYTLRVVIDNHNYVLGSDSKLITVNPAAPEPTTKPEGVQLPTWAIIAIAAGGAFLLFILIIVIVTKRRKTVIVAGGDDDGFSDDYTGD